MSFNLGDFLLTEEKCALFDSNYQSNARALAACGSIHVVYLGLADSPWAIEHRERENEWLKVLYEGEIWEIWDNHIEKVAK